VVGQPSIEELMYSTTKFHGIQRRENQMPKLDALDHRCWYRFYFPSLTG